MKELLINEQIKSNEVRLISSTGEQLGIVSFNEALNQATNEGLDLVMINPTAKPAVCKILNYGKYKFEFQKKQKEARKKQREKMVELKGMRLSLGIGEHDMEFKAKTVNKFLSAGNKVKVTIRLRGRERAYKNQGFDTMNHFVEMIAEYGMVEKKPALNGNIIIMILAPKK